MGLLIQVGRIVLAIVAGFIAGWLLVFVAGLRFLPPGLMVPACMVAAWFLLPRVFPAFKPRPKTENAGPITLQVNGQPFQATHHTRNIAINATTGQVWFRDTQGREWLLDRADVRTWDHQWVDHPIRQACGHRAEAHGAQLHQNHLQLGFHAASFALRRWT